MKTKPMISAPRRWSDAQGHDGEPELGHLFENVIEPEALGPAELAKVHARLGSTRRSGSRRVRELSLATGMLIAGSSIAFAGWGVSEWWSARSTPAPLNPTRKAAPEASAAPVTRSPHTASGADQPPLAKEPEPDEAAQAVDPTPAPLTSARASERSLAESRALDAESQALAAVLVKLRREHDARGALALLDQSQALFAHGALGLEAQVARIDALLALGRRSEALALLDHLPFAQVGRGGELRLVRAELRASTDCGLALSDFDALVRQALPPALAERVLYGRAACELQVGDHAHADQDLRQYLERFPQGRFAAQVTSQLARRAAAPDKQP